MAARGAVQAWVTTPDRTELLSRRPDVELGGAAAPLTVTVDDRQELQPMVGFGASFTESAAVVVHDRLGAP